jgi:hypothetical protein
MSALDRGGRIADRAAIEALDWTPGTRLHLDANRTHLTLSAAIDGALAVKDHRYLWLPRRGPAPARSTAGRSGAAGRTTAAADVGRVPTGSA